MIRRITGISFLLLLFAGGVIAQRRRPSPAPKPQLQKPAYITRSDTTIKGATLEVYQEYQPELKPVIKPELSPVLPPPVKDPVPQQYEVPQQTLYYSYRSLPLRPLALGKDTAPPPPAGYALIAGGNLSTILAEAGLGSLHGDDWQAALHARYVTQTGALEGQIFRNFKLDAAASLREGRHLLKAALDVHRDVFGTYGYNHDAHHYAIDQVRRVYSGARLTIGAENIQAGWFGLDYQPSVTLSYFNGTAISYEQSLDFSMPVSKRIDSSLTLGIGIKGALTGLYFSPGSATNNYIQITPGMDYRRGAFSGHLGVYPTFGRNNLREILPDITVRYRVSARIIASGGWQAGLVQNTAQQLVTVNPFLTLSLTASQTLRQEIYGSLSLGIANHLSVWGRIGYHHYRDLPLFITRPGGDGKDFLVRYAHAASAVAWSGGIRYAVGDDFSIRAEGAWYSYTIHDFSRVLGEPGVRLHGDISWHILQELQLGLYTEVLDRIWDLNVSGAEVQLKGVLDAGISAECTFVKNFNLFVRTENLLNRGNERWLGYPSFGLGIYGGLRFRF